MIKKKRDGMKADGWTLHGCMVHLMQAIISLFWTSKFIALPFQFIKLNKYFGLVVFYISVSSLAVIFRVEPFLK